MVDRFWNFRILAKFWELFGFLAHMEPKKIWVYFFLAEKLIFHYINHPYKRPNFGRAGACFIFIVERSRRRFRKYSWAFRIGAKKSRIFFSRSLWPPLMYILSFLNAPKIDLNNFCKPRRCYCYLFKLEIFLLGQYYAFSSNTQIA